MGGTRSVNIFNCQEGKQQCFLLFCALLSYLDMIYKSFILNLNLIDPTDLRMHPLLGVCPAWEQCVCVCGERRYRDRLCQAIGSAAFGGTTHMPGVKLVSSGKIGQLSCLGPCIVLINAAAVSYQECLQGEAW